MNSVQRCMIVTCFLMMIVLGAEGRAVGEILGSNSSLVSGDQLLLDLKKSDKPHYILDIDLDEIEGVYFSAQVMDQKGSINVSFALNQLTNSTIEEIPFIQWSSDLQVITKYDGQMLQTYQEYINTYKFNQSGQKLKSMDIFFECNADSKIKFMALVISKNRSQNSNLLRVKSSELQQFNLNPLISNQQIEQQFVQQFNLVPDFEVKSEQLYVLQLSYDSIQAKVLLQSQLSKNDNSISYPVLTQELKQLIVSQEPLVEQVYGLQTLALYGSELKTQGLSVFVVSVKKFNTGPISIQLSEVTQKQDLELNKEQSWESKIAQSERFSVLRLYQTQLASQIIVRQNISDVIVQVCQINQVCQNSSTSEINSDLETQKDLVISYFSNSGPAFKTIIQTSQKEVKVESGYSIWIVIGAGAGFFVGGILLGILIYYCVRKNTDKKSNPSAFSEQNQTNGYLNQV